jgi:hypothetical protein
MRHLVIEMITPLDQKRNISREKRTIYLYVNPVPMLISLVEINYFNVAVNNGE